MKIHNIKIFSLTGIAFLWLAFAPQKSANASTLLNEWYYAPDSPSDSISGDEVGGTKYEIYNMALKQTPDKVFIAINSNLSLQGTSSLYAHDKHVSWGDLFLNFTGKNFDAANGNSFAIRFAGNNESGVGGLGLFGDVTAKAIATQNGLQLENLAAYNNWVQQNGKTPSIGDLAANDPYFNQSIHIPNVIASGTKIGDIDLLDSAALNQLGLDFAPFSNIGSHTFGLSFNRSLLPTSSLIAHLGPECNNDITAWRGELKSVPESSNMVGLAAVGLILTGLKGRKFQKNSEIVVS